jgi:hypothetical protein
LVSLGLPLVQEVVELAVAGGDLAVAGAGGLPGWFGGGQQPLVVEEPLEVLAGGCGVVRLSWSGLLRGAVLAAAVGWMGG